ncbi:8077_t:CDS:2 [Scutellospora calospora]|uniref:8077_t:CDS:1 n=1 Tax=Scutellospora calospora TaxID=85575 RepID=A0ACA9LEB7_9GLOM|nr:8077_t:CDS:2 [Scutellospora calospora]
MSSQPLVYVHDKEIVFVEQNDLQQKKKESSLFSSFKVFKLKGILNENDLYNAIFPRGKKNFRIETSNYTGESTKNATSKLLHFSENGLSDWFPTDSMTLKTIYPSINDQIISSSTNLQNDVSNYQVIDEEKLRADIKSLSEELKLKRQNYPDNIFDKLFYDTFRRRDMSVSLNDLKSEFFNHLDSVQLFLGVKKEIQDNDMLCPDKIQETIIRYMFKSLEYHLFDITLNSIFESYQELQSVDQSIKIIFEEEKPKIRNMTSNMEICRLSIFCEATICLLELIKHISVKCDEQVKRLEGQSKSLTTKLLIGAGTLALAVGSGILYASYIKDSKKDSKNNSKNDSNNDNSSFEKYAKGAAIAAVGGLSVFGGGLYVLSDLQTTVSRITDTLKQLRHLHDQLNDWSFHGKRYLDWDYEEMCEYKSHLFSQFSDIKEQCKKLDSVLDY